MNQNYKLKRCLKIIDVPVRQDIFCNTQMIGPMRQLLAAMLNDKLVGLCLLNSTLSIS
jgi:hypothetical protein